MKNSIAYWVGVAESAALFIELNSASIGEGLLWAENNLDKAIAAHKEAMENLLRIAQGFQKMIDTYAKQGIYWSDEHNDFIFTPPNSEDMNKPLAYEEL